MKAAFRSHYCSPSKIQIKDLSKPIPNKNEVLVKVAYTTVNRTDCANLTAKPFIMRFVLGLLKPRNPQLGTDFSGEIVKTNKSITHLKVGDRVFGFVDTGIKSQAEYLSVDANKVFVIPNNTNYKQAAASLEGAHYAFTFLQKANLESGQSILLNGATGAIGSALLQFLKPLQLKITATANSKHVNKIKALGANEVIDYSKTDFTTLNEKFDFVFDTVGKSTYGKCKGILKANGIYISSELGPWSQNIFYSIFTKRVKFPVPYHFSKSIPFISKQLKNNIFSPLIDRTYTLDNISDAYNYVMSGQKIGNVVLSVNQKLDLND